MLGDATIPSQKLRVVLEHAHVLGLRCASECTVQRITTLFLSVSEGALAAKGMPTFQKLSMTKHVKHELKKMGDNPPLVYMVQLPPMPSQLAAEHPRVFEAVFKNEPPVPMKLDLASFADVMATVRCRGQRAGSSSSLDASSFGQLATGFLQQMQQMQEMQLATYHALTNGPWQSSSRTPSFLLQQEPLQIEDCRPPQLQQQQLLQQQQQLHGHQQQQRSSSSSEAAAAAARQQQQQQQQQRGSSSSEGIAAARAEQQQQQQLQVAVLEPGVSPDGEEVQKGKKEKNEKTEKEQKEQVEQQPPSKAKRPRLSVTDSIALISSRLDERNASKVVAGSSAKKAAKADAKAASVFERGCRLTFSIERSRKRVQCRASLKRRGQSCSITFASAGGEQQAVAKAQKWVKMHEERCSVGVRL